MNDCHIDDRCEKLIGEIVIVTLKDDFSKKYLGKLRKPEFGYGYVLECFNYDYNLRFNKSQLKSINKYKGVISVPMD